MNNSASIKLKTFFLGLIFLYVNFSFSQEIIINSNIDTQPIFKVYPINEKNKKASDLFKVFIIQDEIESKTELLGNYTIKNDTLIFKPEFELGPNLSFNAYYYEKDTIKKNYKTKPLNINVSKEVTVKAIYPKLNKIPRNILSFHVEFSEPMQTSILTYQNINLYNEKKELIPHVWYNKSRWITDKIMILMIHPGRVKNNVSYFENLGELFEVNKKYFLEINDQIKPQNLNSKLKPFIKEFEIIEPSYEIPKIISKSISSPKQNSKEKLKIFFNKPMDFISIILGIDIYIYKTDTKVEGSFEQGGNDNEWYFIPKADWLEKKYTIVFNKYVCDPSGNSLIKLFETKSIKASYNNTIAKKINFNTN